MYKYLTIAPNVSERGVSPMYLYKNENNVIYISQIFCEEVCIMNFHEHFIYIMIYKCHQHF
jgi:hypothetical protein